MKIKIKKILVAITIMIILLVLVITGYEIYILYNGNLDKSNPMTREEISELLDQGAKYDNFLTRIEPGIMSYGYEISGRPKEIIYVKDNVIKTVVGDRTWQYDNFNTDEHINILGYPIAFVSSAKEYFGDYRQKNGIRYNNYINNSEEYDFEYLGKKEINGRDTVIVKFVDKKHMGDYNKIYIDKENGVIMNMENYYCYGFIYIKTDFNMKVEFDCVTEEDVKRPNLIGYVIKDYRELSK